MDVVTLVLQHKKFAIAFFSMVILVLLFTLSSLPSPQISPTLLPTPTLVPLEIRLQKKQGISDLQKTVVGKTTQDEVSQLFGIGTIATRGATTTYTLPSSVNLLPNEVQTENGVVVFEKIITPKDPKLPGFNKISDMKRLLGNEQERIEGSKIYGSYIIAYIYANKGITFLGNPNTDIVYEIHLYKPTTVENYKTIYGKDLGVEAHAEGIH